MFGKSKLTKREKSGKQKKGEGDHRCRCVVIRMREIMHSMTLIFMLVSVFFVSSNFLDTRAQQVAAVQNTAYLAIVIDDFGYGGEGSDEMLALDVPITCAVLPFSEGTQDIILQVENSGKEAIIHMPMESLHGKKSWVGDRGIFMDMTDEEVRAVVEEALDREEKVVGLNNHMGSAIMEDENRLKIVIEALKERDMYLLDSMTTPNSLAETLCEEFGICFMKRDVFLDGTDDLNRVKQNLKIAAEVALKNGSAVAIGHVGPEGGMVTVNAIQQMQKELEDMGIQFVTLTQLKEIKNGTNVLYN